MESLPSLSVITTGFLVHPADAEDGRLRLVDDGRAELFAEDARLVSVNVPPETSSVASFLPRARSATSTMARAMPRKFFSSVFLMTGTIKSHPVERHRDTDADVLVVADRVAFHESVDDGVLAQRIDSSARDEGHVGKLHAVALFVLGLLCSRAARTMRVMSTLNTVWTLRAAECLVSTMRFAMICRIFDIGTSSPGIGAGAAGLGAAAAGAAAGFAATGASGCRARSGGFFPCGRECRPW